VIGTIALIVGGCLLGALALLWLIGERWRPMRRSTWRFIRAGGWRRFFKLTTLHGYVYARWTNQYIRTLIGLGRPSPRMGKRLSDHYHGKVLTHDHARAIVTNDRDIPLRDLEQIVPYPLARDLVLKGPPDLAAYECACRHARKNPCRPTQVCMVVGEPFVDFVLEHNPRSSRRLTREEALELLAAEHRRGHVHSAWFKDAMLGRFYAICNCCKCCCAGIRAMVRGGAPMMVSSGYVAKVDEDRCVACGNCAKTCPFEAVEVNDKAVVKWDACMGCGACLATCPKDALSLLRDERKGIPLDVRLLGAPAP
jgi:Pyruvate/2-oxoacid:ferredoxin oxidoreductase delta subunit